MIANPKALLSVPVAARTYDVCVAAVLQHGRSLLAVPACLHMPVVSAALQDAREEQRRQMLWAALDMSNIDMIRAVLVADPYLLDQEVDDDLSPLSDRPIIQALLREWRLEGATKAGRTFARGGKVRL